MENFDWSQVIEAMKIAASGNLGVIALIVVAFSIVGIVLFRNASDLIKAGGFSVLLVGVCSFAYATMQITADAQGIQNTDTTAAGETATAAADKTSTTTTDKTGTSGFHAIIKPKLIQPLSVVKRAIKKTVEGYIYLGTYKDGKWVEPRFASKGVLPSVNNRITLTSERPLLECAPYRKSLLSLRYTFCDEKAKIASGSTVTVVEAPVSVGLNRIWAKVRYTP
jgi:hypothetical protein